MPRETLRALENDIERLLHSGASAAASDDGLAARRSSLEGFAAKAPALAKVAEQVGRVLGARPREAATELLNLAVMDSQLRGAQAGSRGTDGELRALAESAPLETPLLHSRVTAVAAALAGTSEMSATKVLDDALERGEVVDLRLLGAWLDALASTTLGEHAVRALPLYGRAARSQLLARLALDGGSTEARVLRCLAKVLPPDEALETARRTLAEGSPTLRAAAVTVLCELDRAEGTRVATEALRSDRAAVVRAAAAEALAGTTDEAVVGLLLDALDDSQEVAKAAFQALQATTHPAMAKRLLKVLTPAALAIKNFVWKRTRNRTKLTPAQHKAQSQKQNDEYRDYQKRVARVQQSVTLLGHLDDPAGNKLLASLITRGRYLPARIAAANTAVTSPNAALRATVTALMWSSNWSLKNVAWRAFLEDRATLFDRVAPYFTDKALKGPKGTTQATALLLRMRSLPLDGDITRWGELCGTLFKRPKLAVNAALLALQLKYEPLLADALAILEKSSGNRWIIPQLLGAWRHPLCAKSLHVFWKKSSSDRVRLGQAMAFQEDAAALPLLRAELEKLKKSKAKRKPTWQINALTGSITSLESAIR